MTEPEDFLSRWSRRKRGAKAEAETEGGQPQTREQPVGADAVTQNAQPASLPAQADTQTQANLQTAKANPEDAFDLSKLPSLDSIGAATDIRVFMQPGVPAALSRAALRRAWSADPAIRDFIGLAENSWDFTASDGMHGFGALDPADAKRLLAQLFSENDRKDEGKAEDQTRDASAESAMSDVEAPQDEGSDPDSTADTDVEAIESERLPGEQGQIGDDEILQHNDAEIISVASQQKQTEPSREVPPMPRSHGRALPQ